jgi:peroxiredoxin
VIRSNRLRNSIWLIALGLWAAASGCGSDSAQDSSSDSSAQESSADAASESSRPAAPDFSLRDVDGVVYSLRDYRGKVVFVNFWATWCPPCRREIPDLMALQNEHEGDLVVLGISLDREGAAKVKPFVEQMGITYPILVDGDNVAASFGPFNSIPMTFVVDRDGRIAEQIIGLQSKEYLHGIIEELKQES